jgi:hypothetical protein
MIDKWYADKRDLVKWGSIISIAKSENISKIIQVAFYRKDDFSEKIKINVDDKKISFPQEVWNHFRKLEDITRLDQTLNITVDVYKEPFQWSAPFTSRKEFRVDFFKKLLDKLSNENDRIISRPRYRYFQK